MKSPFRKTELRRRLEAVGLWNKFVARREELKKEGMAPDQAWQHAYEEFQERLERAEARKKEREEAAPVPQLNGPLINPPDEIAQGRRHKRKAAGQVDGRAEVDWVYRNIDEPNAEEKPPSTGTEGLLKWARENRSEFYRMWAATSLPSKAQVEADQRRTATDRTVDQLLKDLRRATREGDDEVLPGSPQDVPGEP